jgi:hypothetical protein
MTPQEQQDIAYQAMMDQIIEGQREVFYDPRVVDDIRRIADHGPDGSERDDLLVKMVFNGMMELILGRRI